MCEKDYISLNQNAKSKRTSSKKDNRDIDVLTMMVKKDVQ